MAQEIDASDTIGLSSKDNKSQGTRFFDLPPEIRNEIYQLVFINPSKEDAVHAYIRDCNDSVMGSYSEWAWRARSYVQKYREKSNPNVRILCVCEAFNVEARRIFYEKNTFCFHLTPYPQFPVFHNYAVDIGGANYLTPVFGYQVLSPMPLDDFNRLPSIRLSLDCISSRSLKELRLSLKYGPLTNWYKCLEAQHFEYINRELAKALLTSDKKVLELEFQLFKPPAGFDPTWHTQRLTEARFRLYHCHLSEVLRRILGKAASARGFDEVLLTFTKIGVDPEPQFVGFRD